MMTLAEFHNGLRLLRSIDEHEVCAARASSAGGVLLPDRYEEFRRDPYRFFITCDDDEMAVIWAAMVRRGAIKPSAHDPLCEVIRG